MNKLYLGLDTFNVSWRSDLRFPWPPWHVWCITRPVSLVKKNPTTDSSMHDRLGKHDPHMYNQLSDCRHVVTLAFPAVTYNLGLGRTHWDIMSHPNPYLFQISRLVQQAWSRMDNQQVFVRTRCRRLWTLGMYFLCFGREVLYCCLYERVLLYKYSFEVNFNVSNTKDNAHAKLSRYV